MYFFIRSDNYGTILVPTTETTNFFHNLQKKKQLICTIKLKLSYSSAVNNISNKTKEDALLHTTLVIGKNKTALTII